MPDKQAFNALEFLISRQAEEKEDAMRSAADAVTFINGWLGIAAMPKSGFPPLASAANCLANAQRHMASAEALATAIYAVRREKESGNA